MGIDFSKADAALVNDGGAAIDVIEIIFAWEDTPAKGLKAKFGLGASTDVDAAAIYYVNKETVGYAGPERLSALSGAITHGGNVKKGQGENQGETLTIDLTKIKTEDRDVEGIALVASCARGDFDKVDSATARIYDVSNGARTHLGNVRVPIQGNHTGVVIGGLKQTNGTWTFTKAGGPGSRGAAREWRQLGDLAKAALGY